MTVKACYERSGLVLTDSGAQLLSRTQHFRLEAQILNIDEYWMSEYRKCGGQHGSHE